MGGIEKFPLMVIFVITILIVGGVFIVVMLSMYGLIPGTVAAYKCRWSLQIKNEWNTMMTNYENDVDDATDIWWYLGKVITGDIIGKIGDLVGGTFGSMKMKTDACIENTHKGCTGPADYVATCLYTQAATTYYALGGGTDKKKEDFNLFKVETNITQDGKIHIKTTKDCAILGSGFKTKVRDGDYCNFTFSTLSGRAMVLSMLAACQEHGADSSLCLCFAKADTGHTIGNGIPYGAAYTSGIYIEEGNTVYQGCGNAGSADKLGNAEFPADKKTILFDLGTGKKEYYIRLEGDKVTISKDET